tara:strand:- start:619 stop:948 length:330 start_codon:yes stop_codon:yes gene_type:complete
MVKASWGSKRTCPCGNGVRFYDLNKKEIECPGCGENINVEQLSISTLENNLRKKSQTQIIEEKRIKVDKKPPKNKGTDVEIAGGDTKIDVQEITGEKINKIKSEEKKED